MTVSIARCETCSANKPSKKEKGCALFALQNCAPAKLIGMVLRINPSKELLWRSTSEVQFGSSSDAVRLAQLTAGQERLLGLLTRGIADEYFDDVAEAVAAENPRELLGKLDSVLLRDAALPTQLSAEFLEARFAEICRAQAIHSREGAAILAARQTRKVFVQTETAAYELIVHSLRQSGIGEVLTELRSFDESAEAITAETFDFAVLLSNNSVAPRDYSNWLVDGVAHISAVFDSAGVTISPIIEVAKSPCLSCFHENQTAADAAWPAIASQLLFSKQEFDDSVAVLFAAAIVCQRVLQFVDQVSGFESASAERNGYRLTIGSGQISEIQWQFSAACACRIS